MPNFVTRGALKTGVQRVSTDDIGADDDEDFKPDPVISKKKSPPPPTDKPNLKYVPAPDEEVELDFPADDVAAADPHDLGPSEAATIPEPQPEPEAPAAAEAPAPIRKDIVVRLPSMQKPKQVAPPPPKELGDYQMPAWDCLADAEYGYAQAQESFVREKAAQLERTLQEFNVDAHVVEIDTGPVITMYELALAAGIKVGTITALSNDIQRSLKAETVRIVAPIPGKNTVGIEVPNEQKEKVRLKDLMQLAPADIMKDGGIPIFLGKDASGEPLIADLTKMPHCLIAGTTGSGKSVCINTIIMSIMYTQRPDMVKLILVDPKVVEMAPFRDIPHLMCPVITDTSKATSVLEWACVKMDERYELLAEAGVRNIKDFNKMTQEELIERFQPGSPEEEARLPKKLPYMVVIIDELADLMMTAGKEVESHIVRIAQKARAVGIHLILATQRPQATVVTGLIKSNMPSKIAFRVASKMDSRIVLDMNGAELLLGHGDMLFLPNGGSKADARPGHVHRRQGNPREREAREDLGRGPVRARTGADQGDRRDRRRSRKRPAFRRRRPRGARDQARQRQPAAAPPDDRLQPRQPPDRSRWPPPDWSANTKAARPARRRLRWTNGKRSKRSNRRTGKTGCQNDFDCPPILNFGQCDYATRHRDRSDRQANR